MPGDEWQKHANLRTLYAYMWGHPGKKLLFMGQEFAQEQEWSHERSLDWHLLEQPLHHGMRALVRDLNRVYQERPALWENDFEGEGFYWLEPNDAENSVVAFARTSKDFTDVVAIALNLTPVPRHGYRIGLPREGRWVEAINTDSTHYGGSDTGNFGGVVAEACPGAASRSRPRSPFRRSVGCGWSPRPSRSGARRAGARRLRREARARPVLHPRAEGRRPSASQLTITARGDREAVVYAVDGTARAGTVRVTLRNDSELRVNGRMVRVDGERSAAEVAAELDHLQNGKPLAEWCHDADGPPLSPSRRRPRTTTLELKAGTQLRRRRPADLRPPRHHPDRTLTHRACHGAHIDAHSWTFGSLGVIPDRRGHADRGVWLP